MAKPKGPQGVQNRHIYNRASYLYQAATYLANQNATPTANAATNLSSASQEHSASTPSSNGPKALQNMSRQMISSMRAVTLKAQIRQSTALKQTICKFCDTLLIEGKTCTSTVENASKGGRKPWADVLTIRCNTCSSAKRYPVSALRQKRRSLRNSKQTEHLRDSSTQDKTQEPPLTT
ncbi:RNAse P Rpr2/Rpp21/SNM1 subunit domain-containing protein [Dactylonectria estremocensis]|uniref:RNAse P Rpr2/Rpp21/SNM1 subunit domain-containing protein n=1 Tax=Dactylonectria estremocensis TaxID=1079267 RepID=A0A9P9JHF9_9HYPO|nr:RNAse P Rpr2/Rpp21/SNM1 subunit domain-containing protein [Dactylonectria estremocensis]